MTETQEGARKLRTTPLQESLVVALIGFALYQAKGLLIRAVSEQTAAQEAG